MTITLILVIFLIFFVTILLIIYDIGRRLIKNFKYKKLDFYRSIYLKELAEKFNSSSDIDQFVNFYKFHPTSLRGQALQEVLIKLSHNFEEEVKLFFKKLGYQEYHEKAIFSKNSIKRGIAFKILGDLKIQDSSIKIINTIKNEKNENILLTACMSLVKIISEYQIEEFLKILINKSENNFLSYKSVSLIMLSLLERFNKSAINVLKRELSSDKINDTTKSIFLESLYYIDYEDDTLKDIAIKNLSSDNPELIAKSLKIISKLKISEDDVDFSKILYFLNHPLWYIRLMAIKALKNVFNEKLIDKMVPLLSDNEWPVRLEAVNVLFSLPINIVIKKIPEWLDIKDNFARDTIVEFILKHNWTDKFNHMIEKGDANLKQQITDISVIIKNYYNFNFPIAQS